MNGRTQTGMTVALVVLLMTSIAFAGDKTAEKSAAAPGFQEQNRPDMTKAKRTHAYFDSEPYCLAFGYVCDKEFVSSTRRSLRVIRATAPT